MPNFRFLFSSSLQIGCKNLEISLQSGWWYKSDQKLLYTLKFGRQFFHCRLETNLKNFWKNFFRRKIENRNVLIFEFPNKSKQFDYKINLKYDDIQI